MMFFFLNRSEKIIEFSQKNEIDKRINEIREKTGYDIIQIRSQVIKGKCKYIPKEVWKDIDDKINGYPWKMKYFAIGGIKAVAEDDKVVCLIKA